MTLPDDVKKKVDALFSEFYAEDFDKETCDSVCLAREMLADAQDGILRMRSDWDISRMNALKDLKQGKTDASTYLTYCDVAIDAFNQVVKSLKEKERVLDKIASIKYDEEKRDEKLLADLGPSATATSGESPNHKGAEE